MKSAIASLRSLTLPFGVTTGERIELDGVSGEIRVYDANNDLLIKITGENGFDVYDTDGDLRVRLGTPFFGGFSTLFLLTSAANEVAAAVSLQDFVTRDMNRLVITPGERNNKGAIELTLCSQGGTTLQSSLIQAVCSELAGTLRSYIDFTGAGAPNELAQPYTVVHDLFYGTPNFISDGPTIVGNYPRGWVGDGSSTSDVTLSTTVGVYSDVVQTDTAIDVVAGRKYKVSFFGGFGVVFTGSGFAISDTVEFDMQRRFSGTWASIGAQTRVRGNISTSSSRWGVPQVIGIYEPGADAAIDFKIRAVRIAGAATVNMAIDTNAGASPFRILVEDISSE